MAQTKSKKANLGALFKNGDILLVAGLFGTVMLMIMPIPSVHFGRISGPSA